MNLAILVAVLAAMFVVIFLPLVLSGERCRAAEDKARARRIADTMMSARLLRFNI